MWRTNGKAQLSFTYRNLNTDDKIIIKRLFYYNFDENPEIDNNIICDANEHLRFYIYC